MRKNKKQVHSSQNKNLIDSVTRFVEFLVAEQKRVEEMKTGGFVRLPNKEESNV